MMRIESLPCWERVVSSGLLQPAQISIVRAEVAGWKDPALKSLATPDPDASAISLAQARLRDWLVSHDLLTPYQAQVLTSDLSGPLELGCFQLVGQWLDWGLPHHYWAIAPELTAAIPVPDQGLRPPDALLACVQSITPQDWQAIRQRVTSAIAATPALTTPHLVLPWAVVEDPPRAAILWPRLATERLLAGDSDGNRDSSSPAAADRMQSLAHRLSPDVLQRTGRPSTKRVLQWTADIAAGLAAFHREIGSFGALHPTAVLITQQKRAAVWSIPATWLEIGGLAAALGSPQGVADAGHPLSETLLRDFLTSHPLGWRPVDFLPPEQIPAKPGGEWGRPTPAGDLYALGQLLYWMLGGEPIPTLADWERARQFKLNFDPGQLPNSIPAPVGKLVANLLQCDPLKRPSSAAEVAAAIQSMLKPAAEPARAWVVETELASEIRRAAGQWPDHCWTPGVASAVRQDLPKIGQSVDAPPMVMVGERHATGEEPSDGAPAGSAGDSAVGLPTLTSAASVRALRQQRSRRRKVWSAPLISCVVSGSAALVVLLWWWVAGPTDSHLAEQANLSPAKAGVDSADGTEPTVSRPTGWNQNVVPDDGQLLWESPTVGLPVEISHLPNGPTGLLVIRGDFWNAPGAASLLRILAGPAANGPAADLTEWRKAFSVDQFSRLLVAQYQALDGVQHAVVLESDEPVTVRLPGWKGIAGLSFDSDEDALPDSIHHFVLVEDRPAGRAMWAQLAELPSGWGDGMATISAERVTAEVFDPANGELSTGDLPLQVRRMVIANPELIRASISIRGETLVPGTMAALLASSDRDLHVQLFVNPVTIWNAQGQDWLGARWSWLGQFIKQRVPTSVRMMAVAVHLDEAGATYAEAKFIADRSRSDAALLGPLMRDLGEMAPAVKRQLLDLPRVAYWENALLRYDNMLADLGNSVRSGRHDRLPTLNAWLRPRALENLLGATELYFMAVRLGQGEAVAWAGGAGGRPAGTPAGPQTLEALLQRPRSLSIPEQDLINALMELETEIKTSYPDLPFDFSIELDGNALRLEGITQNQKVANFRLENRTLAEILTALVLKANPDPAVTDARDPNCKLIWLIDPTRPSGQIRITTRGAARENGWVLPPEVSVE